MYFCARIGILLEYTMMKRFKYLLVALFLYGFVNAYSSNPDSIRLSLMTCAPGSEIYAHFGHTAIRYENYTRKIDLVFNYGMFNFREPNFVWRFVKGETDYQLGITPYIYFRAEYAMRGSSVYQVYRYNYFYDNCTTRARDKIEEAIQGKVVYPDSIPDKTFRSIVHEFTSEAKWDELGIDMCLGVEADRPIGKRLQMFAPFYMLHYADHAYILGANGEKRPLVSETTKIVDVEPEPFEPGFPLSPMACGILFLVVCIVMGWVRWKKRRVWWGWDLFLLLMQGLAGCLVAFLFFFSTHPTVGSNWLLWLFNPIPLFYLPFLVWHEKKGRKDPYHVINIVYLTLFIVIFPICGQEFNLTVLPLALGLLMNSVSHVLTGNKKA